MTPGDVYTVEIEAYPTANLFLKGQRMRLESLSSNFLKFGVNPNTGEAKGQRWQARVGINTVLHGGHKPSALLLPVLPRTGT